MGRFWASKDESFEDMMQSEHRKRDWKSKNLFHGAFLGREILWG